MIENDHRATESEEVGPEGEEARPEQPEGTGADAGPDRRSDEEPDASADTGGKPSRREAWESAFSDFQGVVEDVVGSLRHLAPTGGRGPRYDLIRIPEEGYWVLMDLSGVRKEDLEVATAGDELTVAGERRRVGLPEGAEVLRSERAYGRFRRQLRVPSDVDAEAVQAKLEGGVLKLVLPRRKQAARTQVEVEEDE